MDEMMKAQKKMERNVKDLVKLTMSVLAEISRMTPNIPEAVMAEFVAEVMAYVGGLKRQHFFNASMYDLMVNVAMLVNDGKRSTAITVIEAALGDTVIDPELRKALEEAKEAIANGSLN